MKKVKLILVALFGFLLNNVTGQKVFICEGQTNSKEYHLSSSCTRLRNCRRPPRQVTFEEAFRSGKVECFLCYPYPADNFVIICSDDRSKYYHSSYLCHELGYCRRRIKQVTLEQVVSTNKRFRKAPCPICYPPNLLNNSTIKPINQNRIKPINQNRNDSQLVKPINQNRNDSQLVKPINQNRNEGQLVQCSAFITKAGTRCKRMTRSPNGLCSQHGGN